MEFTLPALLHPRLGTTRALERFRNHVAIASYLRRTVTEVSDLYEDRFSLLGCVGGGTLVTRRVRVRRAAELNALRGWKAALCTAMELADAAAPLLAAAAERLSRLVSWLLVALIGRSLGLVYRGIRESIAGGSGGGGGGGGGGRRRRRRGAPRGQERGRERAEAAPDAEEPLFYGFP